MKPEGDSHLSVLSKLESSINDLPHTRGPKKPIISANSEASLLFNFRAIVSFQSAKAGPTQSIGRQHYTHRKLTIDDIPHGVEAAHNTDEQDQEAQRNRLADEPAGLGEGVIEFEAGFWLTDENDTYDQQSSEEGDCKVRDPRFPCPP